MKRRTDLLAKIPGPSPAKRIFSSGQTLARDGRQVSQAPGKSRTESWTEINRCLQPDSREMPLARKRKEPEE